MNTIHNIATAEWRKVPMYIVPPSEFTPTEIDRFKIEEAIRMNLVKLDSPFLHTKEQASERLVELYKKYATMFGVG